MRILCVLLPHFPLRCEIHRNPALTDRPIVILQSSHGTGSQKAVLDYSPQLSNLQPGMPLQQALAHQGEIELVQADQPFYRSVFNEILDRLAKRSPLVEEAETGSAYLGIDGLQGIYPDDNALTKAVRKAVPKEFLAQIGIAEGKFPSYLAALHSPLGGQKIMAGDISTFLNDFSCDALPVALKIKSKLHEFGLHKLGQLSALSVGPLQAQFGTEGRRIWELAKGVDNTPLRPRSTEETIEESTTLPTVTVSLEALLVTWEFLLVRAFNNLNHKGLGIRSITLWASSWRSEHWEKSVQFKETAMDTRSVVTRVKPLLENLPLPGPVERVGLKVTRLGYQGGRQRSLFTEVRARERLLDDIKQLDMRLGGPQIFRIKEVEPWHRIPERRYALAPVSGS